MRIATVHGCYEELSTLLGQLGYKIENGPDGPTATPPDGRKAVLVGDLVDRLATTCYAHCRARMAKPHDQRPRIQVVLGTVVSASNLC
jgi:hypothetical protein